MSASSMPPSIRSKIALLVLACALPSAIGFGALVQQFYQRERAKIINDTLQAARALSAAVERELGNGELAAKALASSPSLQTGDFASFHIQASSMVTTLDRDATFAITDRSGRQILNTRIPFGQQMPKRGNFDQIKAIFETRKTVFSNLYYGKVLGRRVLSIDVPVVRNGKVEYTLGKVFAPDRLGELLHAQGLAAHLTATLIDANGAVVASLHDPQGAVGTAASAELMRNLRGQAEGTFATSAPGGQQVMTSFHRSPQTGWSVAIGVPNNAILKELLHSVAFISGIAASMLLAGFLLAWRIGGDISAVIKGLAGPARDLAAGMPLKMPPMNLREAQQVADAFAEMAAQILNHRRELEILVAERTAQLEKSTGLLETIYAHAPVGLSLTDRDLRILMVNPYLAGLAGTPPEQQLGRRASEVLGEIGTTIEQACQLAFERAEAVTGIELAGPVPAAPHEYRQLTASYYPVFGPEHDVIGLTGVVLDVSEQKRLECRLRDNEEYFRVLYESSHDAHLLATLNAGFVGANQAAVDLFGCRDIEHMLTLSPAVMSPTHQPDGQPSKDKVKEMMRLTLERGSHAFEWVHRRLDGSEFYADVLLSSLDIGGEGIVQATVRDISERKRTETALRESRLLLSSILENMPAMVFVKNATDLRYEMFNRTGEQIIGRPRSEIIGRRMEDFFPPEEAARVTAIEQSALRSVDYVETELLPLVTAQGETRYLNVRRVALRNDDGVPTHLLGIAIDVTERQRALQTINETAIQLQQSERFLRTITESLPGMVAYWDAARRCRFANRRYLDWYGVSQDEIDELSFLDLMGASAYQVSVPYLDGVLAGQPQSFEREMVQPDGEVRNSWVNYIPDFDDAGAVSGFFVLISDVTVLKQAQLRLHDLNEELVIARDRAEAGSSAKSEFLANMSHEIRTPMNAIIGLARLLEEAPLERRERSYVSKIKLATQSLLGVLNDVLDFSKIEAGRLALEQTRFRLDDILASTAVLVAGNAWAKGVEPVFAVAPEVPLELEGDPMRLQQILLNLVGNAVKFTEQGEVVVSAAVLASDAHAVTLQFSVRDSGIGISMEQQRHMFDAFSQGDSSTSRKYGGTGLGLAICRRLVALMGGQISVSSELGQGSDFRFSAVFARVAGEDGQRTLQRQSGAAGERLSLLIVDDNATVRTALRDSCAALGWQADAVSNAADALASLRRAAREKRMPDLLLLDSAMPDMDGVSLLMLARAERALTVPPVIMMVPEHQSEDMAQIAASLDLAAILTKPATATCLQAAVRTARSGASEPAAVALPTPLSGRLAGMRVLLVEDNEINQEVAQYILLHAGALVEIAANGQLALERMQRGERYDAILMDIQMPIMNGYEATVAIRRLGLESLPIIAMTANVMADDRQRVSEAGMNGHISKPIDVDELIGTLLRLTALEGPPGSVAPDAVAPRAAGGPPAALPGIDLNAALQRFGGNYPAFVALLKRFENSQGDAVAETRRLLGEDKRHAAGQSLHRLRGVAANLGAGEIARLTLQAEAALHEGRDADLATALGALDRAMAQVIDSARTLALPQSAPQAATDAAVPPGGDIGAALAELLALLQNNNMKALTHFQDLRPAVTALSREAALALAEAIETLNFPAAEQQVRQMLRRQGGSEDAELKG